MRLCSLLFILILAGCQPADINEPISQTNASPAEDIALCDAPVTTVGEIQGEGFRSPLEGQNTSARVVVTHTISGQGLYAQEERPTSFAQQSHGIFIQSEALSDTVSIGQLLAVSGLVTELGNRDDTQTALTDIEGFAVCGAAAEPPDIDARLPLSPGERESFENMRVMLEQPLTVTAIRDIDDGEIQVSALGILKAPTEIAAPGPDAIEQLQKNRDWSLKVHDPALSRLEPFTNIQVGSLVHLLYGVLGHDGNELQLLASEDVQHVALPAPEIDPPADNVIRVVGFNLYEYFNGDGMGAGFPGERGAESLSEFEQQSQRIAAALEQIQADVIGVMELENDGFGPQSAAEHLRQMASNTAGAEFAIATPEAEKVGSDVISVGLIYRSDRLEAIGPARMLEGNTFGSLNRVPLGQLFADRHTGSRFWVVVNHLKSKGYCGDETDKNADQNDGQACWNQARTEGARAMVEWTESLAAETETSDFLLIGDFNAYRLEDPIHAIEEMGLTELVAHHHPGIPQYSYVYRGAAGTLDYAFGSQGLTEKVSNAEIWNINSGYPFSSRPHLPWLRSSDHDPVIVDLLLTQSATSD